MTNLDRVEEFVKKLVRDNDLRDKEDKIAKVLIASQKSAFNAVLSYIEIVKEICGEEK